LYVVELEIKMVEDEERGRKRDKERRRIKEKTFILCDNF